MSRKRVRNEIRSYAGTELYERLVREAAARGITLSECVRRELADLYAIRDELADALRMEGSRGSPARGILQKVLRGVEERLGATLAAHNGRLDELAARLSRLEAMIDRFYLGVMLHLADVPEEARPARLKRAAERRHAWREAVDRMVGASQAVPLAGDDVEVEASDKPAKRRSRSH